MLFIGDLRGGLSGSCHLGIHCHGACPGCLMVICGRGSVCSFLSAVLQDVPFDFAIEALIFALQHPFFFVSQHPSQVCCIHVHWLRALVGLRWWLLGWWVSSHGHSIGPWHRFRLTWLVKAWVGSEICEDLGQPNNFLTHSFLPPLQGDRRHFLVEDSYRK